MDEFEKCLNDILVDTFNHILKYEETSLKTITDMPVTLAEAHMIEAISKRGGQSTVSEIASDLNIKPPTATVAVKKLEKKGLVVKMPFSKDGRRFIISLTKKGEKVNRAHSIFHRRMIRGISRGFTDAEKNILLSAAQKLGDFFRKKVKA
ncbi:MAG: MarR family winged helix-turn-helix transcriptional regulator [Eubacteriales bacterium]|jgi:DNA-binding MarR family transcriptional regulator